MTAWTVIWTTAVGGVLAVGAVALLRALWRRRSSTRDAASAVVNTAASVPGRVRQITHQHLADVVLACAKAKKIDVPTDVRQSNPTVVTYHPSGEQVLWYPDVVSYRTAGERREHSGRNARFGRPPTPLKRWTTEQLRSWIDENCEDASGPP